MSKYYAIAVGLKVGIYTTWEEAKVNVLGYPNAKYKKFFTFEDAKEYLLGFQKNSTDIPSNIQTNPEPPNSNKFEKIAPVSTPVQSVSNRDIDSIHIYTDGSHRNGKGGVGIAYVYDNESFDTISYKMLEYPTTNNRAELMAIYMALYKICGSSFAVPGKFLSYKLYSDSEYCVKVFNQYLHHWLKNGFTGSNGEQIKNLDLISGISDLLTDVRKKTTIDIIWVKAHTNNYFNNLVDQLAKNGRDS